MSREEVGAEGVHRLPGLGLLSLIGSAIHCYPSATVLTLAVE